MSLPYASVISGIFTCDRMFLVQRFIVTAGRGAWKVLCHDRVDTVNKVSVDADVWNIQVLWGVGYLCLNIFLLLGVVTVLRRGYCIPKQPIKMYKKGLIVNYNYELIYNI